MSLGSENWVRTWVSAMVSSGSPSTAMARPAPPLDLLMGDQMDVDGSGLRGGGDANTAGEDLRDPAAAAGSQHELGGVDAAGEVQQRGRDVAADNLVVRTAEALDEHALAGEVGGIGTGEPVARGDVHRQQVGAFGTRGDA